jgi:hypothetical protein
LWVILIWHWVQNLKTSLWFKKQRGSRTKSKWLNTKSLKYYKSKWCSIELSYWYSSPLIHRCNSQLVVQSNKAALGCSEPKIPTSEAGKI